MSDIFIAFLNYQHNNHNKLIYKAYLINNNDKIIHIECKASLVCMEHSESRFILEHGTSSVMLASERHQYTI